MKVEGRAGALHSMLKRELAAAHIQKIARGILLILVILVILFLTHINRFHNKIN